MLGATDPAAPSGNKLVRKASDKWGRELALKMSRGGKMSPQIASGAQMSPLQSPPHLCLPQALLLCTRFLICVCFLLFFALSFILLPFSLPCDQCPHRCFQYGLQHLHALEMLCRTVHRCHQPASDCTIFVSKSNIKLVKLWGPRALICFDVMGGAGGKGSKSKIWHRGSRGNKRARNKPVLIWNERWIWGMDLNSHLEEAKALGGFSVGRRSSCSC